MNSTVPTEPLLKPRLAWFSPLNISSVSGSIAAYFSDQLLPFLKSRFEIDLFYDQFERRQDFETYHYLSAFDRHRANPYDAFIYNVEDCASADFVRSHLGVIPGIVIFHDFLFTRKLPLNLAISPWDDIIERFNHRGHEWPERREDEPDGGANTVKSDLKFGEREKKRLAGPFGFREAGLCGVPVFTSEWCNLEFQRNISRTLKAGTGSKHSYFVPCPIPDPIPDANLGSLGSSVSIIEPKAGSTPVICYCGSVNLEHRSHKFLQALSQIRSPYKLRWLINSTEQAAAIELLREFSILECEFIVGRCPQKWSEVVSGAAIAVHTLFSVYGQCNPWLALSLAAGVPSLVSAFQSAEYLSDQVVFKIEPGETEATQIKEVIESILLGRVIVDRQRLTSYALENYRA